ncbi:MAG: hypothetical protein P1V97_21585 [Planctomycetota bacterium]|nr:hypothetical protein [Planctomycetota bacterium]
MFPEKLQKPVTLATISLILGAFIAVVWSINSSPTPQNPQDAKKTSLGAKKSPQDTAGSSKSTPDKPNTGQKAPKSPKEAKDSSKSGQTSPVEQLRASVMGADAEAKGQEVLEARRLLAKILRNHPEWALELAKMLPKLKNRALSFQIALLLGGHLEKEGVRKALIELGRQTKRPLARETAIQALTGLKNDEEAHVVIRNAFEDGQASPGARSSASFALREVINEFPKSEQASIRATAESQVSSSGTHESLRVESLDLLDVKGNPQQKQLAYDILSLKHQATPSMALAAARVLLSAGEKSERVLPLLKQLAQQSLNGPQAKVLEAMLKDQGSASNR